MPKIIDQAIKKALVPLIERVVKSEGTIESYNVRLDDLTTRSEAREEAEGSFGALDAMQYKITTLRVEVVQFQSMDNSMLWGNVSLPDSLSTMAKMPSVMPSFSEHPKVTLHVESVDADESERDEDDLAKDEVTDYDRSLTLLICLGGLFERY
uniref:Polyprotein protein n=1 Tax=Solanum tuberosum TaxID=4113 RepID=M1DLQ7_SOLTU